MTILLLLRFMFLCGQALGWEFKRDTDAREQIVWDACLYPGKEV